MSSEPQYIADVKKASWTSGTELYLIPIYIINIGLFIGASTWCRARVSVWSVGLSVRLLPVNGGGGGGGGAAVRTRGGGGGGLRNPIAWGVGGLGGRGALPADNTPAQRKTPLNPPPPKPLPFLIWLWGVFKQDIQFLRTPPPP